MRIWGWLAGLGLLAALQHSAPAQEAAPYDKVSFYFAAHQDDWQLFMNPSAFEDVTARGTKVVFIYTTAGDAGLGIGAGGKKHPYYIARENGADLAVRFMADAEKAQAIRTAAHLLVNGHSIYRVVYGHTVSYFLRVPDGNPAGTGYAGTGFQSLKRLALGEIGTLSAIDGTTAYQGWSDLVATLRSILDLERERAATVKLNVADQNPAINPGDHSDHLMTAKAALDAAAGLGCADRIHYVDYASAKLPENVTAPLRDQEGAVFAVTAAGVRALDHTMNWRWYHQAYVGRNYFRIERGNGRCDLITTLTASKR